MTEVTATYETEGSPNPEITVRSGDGVGSVPVQEGTTDKDAEVVAKLQKDINALKSTFQKREASLKQQYEQQISSLRQQLEILQKKVIGEDEQARKEYDTMRLAQENEELRQQLNSLKQQTEVQQAAVQWRQFFAEEFGLPISAFSEASDPSEVLEIGFKELKGRLEQANKSVPKVTPSNQNPTVVPTTPQTGAVTFADLVKRFGSEEQVFQMAEEGAIDLTKVLPK